MAKYRVLTKSFIDNRTYDAGDTVEYDGLPAENLEPLDKDASKAKDEVDKSGEPTNVIQDWAPANGDKDAAVVGTAAAQPGGKTVGS